MKNREKFMHVGMIVIALCIMAAFWPLKLIRADVSSSSNSAECSKTGRLEQGSVCRQIFIPAQDYIETISFVVAFSEIAGKDAAVVFELYDDAGQMLKRERINMTQMSSKVPYPVALELPVRKGAVYEWRLSPDKCGKAGPRLLYTTDPVRGIDENQKLILEREAGAKIVAGQAVTRYDYKKVLPGVQLTAVFTWIVTAALLLMSAIHKKEKIKQTK